MQHRRTTTEVRLTRALAAAGLALACAAAALAVPSPAQAAVVTVSVAAPAGTAARSATATCPAGQYLTGAGGSVSPAGGNVTMTDLLPDLATASVTVWGHVNPGALPAFDVVAQAICAPGAPPANYQLVQAASPLNANPNKTQQATCPANTRLLGSGMQLDGAIGQAFPQRIEPNAALTAVQATAAAAGGFAGNWRLTTYGICGTPPAGFQLLSSSSAVNNVNPRAVTSPGCPAGWLTTGVGAETTANAAGNVVLRQATTNITQDRATAGAIEDGAFGAAWGLSTHNVCWQL